MKILVPLDGSPLAQSALPQAVALARRLDATLILLRVVQPTTNLSLDYGMNSFALLNAVHDRQAQEADFYLRDLAHQPDVAALQPRVLRRSGEAAESILVVADELKADMIVMATHGRQGLSRLLSGSVAERVRQHARVPVLLVQSGQMQQELPPHLLTL